MKYKFNHFNFNVVDLNKSIKFYEEALGLKEVRRKEAKDGSFILAFMGDEFSDFTLELTCMRDRVESYDLGDEEFHLALNVDNYDESFKKHEKMGCIEYVNDSMGIYFITDPDGYWIEIIPTR